MSLFGRLLQLIGLATVLGALALATMLALGAQWLAVSDNPKALDAPADAIVTLGGAYTRPLHAADLYNRFISPVVYVSVTAHQMAYDELAALGITLPEQHEVYAKILERKGVPPLAVRFFGTGSVSTLEEAEALKRTMETPPARLVLVTSPYHARRARMIFRDHFPDTEVLVCPTPYEPSPANWWQDRDSAVAVIMESLKTLYYICGGGFRSQAAPIPSSTAGAA